MKDCPKCGAIVRDDAEFCPGCGGRLQVSAESPAAPARAGFCGSCGERLQEGAAFCPNCGAPVRAGEPGKKNAGASRKVKTAGICAAVVVVVAALAILAATLLPGLSRSDAEDFVYYQQQLLVDPMLNAAASGVNGVLGMLNTDLTVTAHMDDPTIGALLDGASVTLKIKTERGRVVLNADAGFMGSQILTAAGYFENGVLGFYLPQARDVLYTMDISDQVDLPDNWPSGLDAGELTRCVQKYLDIVFSTVNDENLTVEKKKTVPYTALEGAFTGTLYTFAPTAGDIQNLLESLAGALEEDAYLAGLLDARADASGQSGKELLARAAEELRDAAREAGKAVEDAGFQWTLGMEGKTVRRILIAANGVSVGYETSGDEEDAAGQRFAFFAVDERGETSEFLSGEISREGKERTGRVELDTGEGVMDLRFRCEPENRSPLGFPCGSYQVTVNGPDEPVTFGLEVKKAEDGSFDHIFSTQGLTVTVNATEKSSAAMPDAPTEDISDYSPEELEALFYDLGYAIGRDLGLDLEGILGGLDGDGGYDL